MIVRIPPTAAQSIAHEQSLCGDQDHVRVGHTLVVTADPHRHADPAARIPVNLTALTGFEAPALGIGPIT